MTHRCITLIISLLAVAGAAYADNNPVTHTNDYLYAQIDSAIMMSPQYVQHLESEIAALKGKYGRTAVMAEKYDIAENVYRKYYSFRNDSALKWIEKARQAAVSMKRNDLVNYMNLCMCNQYGISGYYTEAEIFFKRTDVNALAGEYRAEYYFVAGRFYGDYAFYSKDKDLKRYNYAIADAHIDTLFTKYGNSHYAWWKKTERLTNKGLYDEALKENDKWMRHIKFGTHEYAIMAFYRSEIYHRLNRQDERKRWLSLSAICDITNAVMDQSSLWSLADILNNEGYTAQALRYMNFSWECVSAFSTHLRGWQVTPVIALINDSYRAKLNDANDRLVYMIVVISLLSAFLLGFLYYIQRKRTQLAKAKDEAGKANEQLMVLNTKLQETNEKLTSTNRLFEEADKMKDEYIGKFLSTCSDYIDKMDNYRIKVNRKLKAKQYADLMKMTDSDELRKNEQKDLFKDFDTVFLHLFPNFKNDLNMLLKPECHIENAFPNMLTTEQRIFALIRLGINESSRIAEFLGYSPTSIYNYRSRMKNKARGNRDEFEEKVKEITMW